MKLGLCLESMGLSFRLGLQRTAEMGVRGVQLDARGDLSPERLGDTGRREIRNLLKTYDLHLTALNCPLRFGIDVFENQQPRIEFVKLVMQLAFDLGPRLIVIQCPRLPEDETDPRAIRLREALVALGIHGDRTGCRVALEIGLDPTEKVRDYLNSFDLGSLGVNYDPANMLVNQHDPIKSLMPLQGKILQIHARDARSSSVSRGAAEVALGAGDIDWLSFIGTLTAVEYTDWVVIEREQSENRLADMQQAVSFLKRFVL
jgi:sugar phosphate isomerase/epimerase